MTRAVVITGASSGIGRATALLLARRGWRVYAGVRREADGTALEQEAGGQLRYLLLEVTEEAAIAAALARVASEVGEAGLQGLVNNAGISLPGPLETMPMGDLRRMFEINVFAPVAMVQAFLPLLRQGRGRVVQVGSAASRVGIPLSGAYSGSKAALAAIGDALAGELVPWGIPVSTIEPGSIRTPIWDKALAAAQASGAERHAGYAAAQPRAEGMLRRAAALGIPPERVARAIVRALEDRPAARQLVGVDARAMGVLGHLPARLARAVGAWAMGLRPLQ